MPFNRQTSLLWVGLVALAAALIAVQPRSSTRDDTSKTGKKTTETTPAALGQNDAGSWPGGGPLDPIRRFFLPAAPKGNAAVATNLPFTVQSAHVSAGSLAVTLAPTQPPADPYDWSKIDLTGYSIRFLIATVPDPADSGLGYLFDQTMAAIQRALEMEEYVIDRAWLPWKPSGAEAGKSGPDPRLQDKHPGLILFRRGHIGGEAKRSVLAMLLVGETPTSGIHKGAFQNAVRIIRNCPAEAMPETERERIRVVGPYFSGSSISLRTVLERALRDLGGMTEADRK